MRGSCLCGQIEYEVSRLDSPIEHCSCRYCRKAHAAAFNTAAAVKLEHFRWLMVRSFSGHMSHPLESALYPMDSLARTTSEIGQEPPLQL